MGNKVLDWLGKVWGFFTTASDEVSLPEPNYKDIATLVGVPTVGKEIDGTELKKHAISLYYRGLYLQQAKAAALSFIKMFMALYALYLLVNQIS